MNDALEYYKILDLTPLADVEEIKNAYRNKAKIWHPDSNQAPEAAEMFRLLSEAHKVLSDDKLRNQYDILSLCCDKDNYPNISEISLVKDGTEDVDLRVVEQKVFQAWFIKYKSQNISKAVSYKNALNLNLKNAAINWLAGWWHYKAFVSNFIGLMQNFRSPVSSKSSCRVLLLNMFYHAQKGQPDKAARCGLAACDFLDIAGQNKVKKYIAELGAVQTRPHRWNITKLRLAQLVAPLAIALFVGGAYLRPVFENIISPKETINYYQNVKMQGRGSMTDDMVVGKVINIPVDKGDESKLYHFKKSAKIMYGPSEKFDVLKTAFSGMTVRLTGRTPDNAWARVMIDNGEMGFVPFEFIESGRGAEIPFGSAIGE